MTRECVESLNLTPNQDFDVDTDQPAYNLEDLDVYGGLNKLGNPGTCKKNINRIILCVGIALPIEFF